ncbi:hypothetical protein Poli38472_000659 [Pythium oligandrum]|uniref:Uncharacterized protein n=1 Tax=Pythium oligandrum TaxID=41045 RepID=A0A8K1FIB8_PYTOL|nr:hypothetical protein Poli38472_000659 [Pythium oligandrum]|eukprot:TMW60617.1 hypothetical protein Poli38472_000659 [Pythium oligandrum]
MMLELMHSTTAVLLGGWSEVQIALLVLGVLVVAVALLSYFVIAPEYEKHLEKQYAAIVHQTTKHHISNMAKKTPLSRSTSMGKDPEGYRAVQRVEATFREATIPENIDRTETVEWNRRHSGPAIPAMAGFDLNRRRKSESDAVLRMKAEMLRRRVMLCKIEREIDGAIQETEEKTFGLPTRRTSFRMARQNTSRTLGLSDEQLKVIQEHPADCTTELQVLAKTQDAATIRKVLRILHDVISFYLSVDHRDVNKVTVFCNSLIKHDSLNHLQSLRISNDAEVRRLANQIIEKAVPAIWH